MKKKNDKPSNSCNHKKIRFVVIIPSGHTLATTLMENNVSVDDIAGILGQQSTESTPIYLKSSLDLLRACSLDPEVE